jgi:hypothetical protein
MMLYEYVDGNGNGILDDNINIEPDFLVSGYKIVTPTQPQPNPTPKFCLTLGS